MEALEINQPIEPIRRLDKDLRLAARSLQPHEVRYVVDIYYQLQKQRIRSKNQLRAAAEQAEPNDLLLWVTDNMDVTERAIPRAMNEYVKSKRPGRWLLSVHGIGPVISAGLLAHIDPEIATTVGKIWRFAGLDPTVKWEKGQKRPWNAALKTLCWKIGKSFVMLRASDKDFYGKLYEERKTIEQGRNERGEFAEQAAASLQAKRYGDDTQARKHYEAGRLPPARIDMRARRWVVKLFLSHFHHVLYECHRGTKPPHPFVFEHLGHVDLIQPPGWPCD